MNLKRNLFKQSKPRLWLGAIRDMIQRGQSYYGMFNVFVGLATLYTVREALIRSYVPWINFFILLGIIAIMQIIIIIIDYKFIYPSQIAFHQHEAYKHRSLLRRDLETANKRQAETYTRIKAIEKVIKKIAKELKK